MTKGTQKTLAIIYKIIYLLLEKYKGKVEVENLC